MAVTEATALSPLTKLSEWKAGQGFTRDSANELVAALRAIQGISPARRAPRHVGIRYMSENVYPGTSYSLQSIETADPVPKYNPLDWKSGDDVTAERLNVLVDATRELLGMTQAPNQAQSSAGGTGTTVSEQQPEGISKMQAQLDRWTKGEELTAAKLNQPIVILNKVFGQVIPPRQLWRFVRGS